MTRVCVKGIFTRRMCFSVKCKRKKSLVYTHNNMFRKKKSINMIILDINELSYIIKLLIKQIVTLNVLLSQVYRVKWIWWLWFDFFKK